MFLYCYGSNTAVFVPFCTEYTKTTPTQAQISYGSLKCGPSFCTAVLLLATLHRPPRGLILLRLPRLVASDSYCKVDVPQNGQVERLDLSSTRMRFSSSGDRVDADLCK